MNKLIAMAVPILPGQTDHWHRFLDTLKGDRLNEFKANREKLGVRERVFFQQTPQGDMAIVTLEGNDPEAAFKRFAEGNDAFTRWFVDEVKAIHGFDLSSPPQGAMPELYVDSGEVGVSAY
ncbi:MAG TPA: hypothetical protein VGK10_00690 [Prolixibacteraceae bacterium]|jgi:hypothetical protein